MARPPKYHRRADGLLETTRTDKRTGKRIHFYGHTDSEIDDQIMAYTSKSERGRMFQEVAVAWHGLHFPTLSPNTKRSYQAAYQRGLDTFGDDPIRSIRPQDIKRYINEFSREGRSKKNVMNQMLILNLIFSFGVESGDIDYSPCDHIKIPKNLPKGHRDAASQADEAMVKESVSLWLLPYLILYTGLRKGEALALTMDDIDISGEVIHITKSVYHESSKAHIKCPKTEAGNRQVPILGPLLPHLPTQGSGYIFSCDGGKTPLTHGEYNAQWKKYAAATGITCTAHQLRHSYATMLFELGIEVKDAQDLLGHSTAAMTQDIYTHIRDDRKKQIAATINAKLKAAQSE